MINLYKPYMPANLPELNDILYSGALAYGKWGKLFEASLQDFLKSENRPLTVSSFTAAIQVVLSTLGLLPGDEVIASPQCCLASTMPMVSYGIKVIWADIDPSRGTLCPESVKLKISIKTKAIFHNHHCGYPGYIDEIKNIAYEKGLYYIDDCIEAFGAKYKGCILGKNTADVTLFSFQTVRLPNTIDGAAILFKDDDHVKKAMKVRDLGVDRSTFRCSSGEISLTSDVSLVGYGVTMSEVNSYIGFNQMQDISNLFEQQSKNAIQWIQDVKEKYPELSLLNTSDITPSYWIFGVLSSDKEVTMKNFKQIGFSCSSVHIPNSYYSIFGKQAELKGVMEFYNKFLALPSGWWYQK